MAFDRFGRQINYLRISLTDKCNLRCIYCMPEDMVFKPTKDMMQDDEIKELARLFATIGFQKVRLTGGEPTIRHDIVKIVQDIATTPGIRTVTMTTNGLMLPKLAIQLANVGLQRVNISLDTLNPYKYNRLTRRGDLDDVWEGILAAEKAGLTPIKLNAVIVRGYNEDDIPDLARLTIDHNWQLRFIEMMPFDKVTNFQIGGLVPVAEMITRLESNLGEITPLQDGELDGEAQLFTIPGAKGTIGFISSISAPFCFSCTRARLTADGILRLCLLQEYEVDLLTLLRKGASRAELKMKVLNAVWNKPWGHGLAENKVPLDRVMNQIGG